MSARSKANPKKHAVVRSYVTKPSGQVGLEKAASGLAGRYNGLNKNTPRTPTGNRQKPNGKENTASVVQTQKKGDEDLPTTRQKSNLKKAANEQKLATSLPETGMPPTEDMTVNLLTVRQSNCKGMFSFFNKKSARKQKLESSLLAPAPPTSPRLESAEDLDKMNQENIKVEICVDKICKDKTCVEEICVEEICVDEICVDEICVEEICVEEICVDEICVDEICVEEICVDEICVDEIFVDEICEEKICEDKIFKEEICKDEICKDEICKDEICKEKIFKEEIFKEEVCKDKIRKDKICEESAIAQLQNVNNIKLIKLIKKAHQEESLQEMIDSVRAEFENKEMLKVLQRCEQLLMKLGLLKPDNSPTEEQHEESMPTNLKKEDNLIDDDDAINSALNMKCLESPQFKPIVLEYQDRKIEIKQNFPGFSKECKQARCQRMLTRCELNLRFYEKMQCAEKELLETMIKVMKDDDYDVLAKPKTIDEQKQSKDDDAFEQNIDHTLPNFESTEDQDYTDEQISLWSEDSFTELDFSDVSSYDTYSD